MLVHTVLFWLKDELDAGQRANFRAGLDRLTTIESAAAVYVGTPAATAERAVVDTSYDFCLTVIAEDVAAHDAYQVDPRHTEFIKTFKDHWQKVLIYDVD